MKGKENTKKRAQAAEKKEAAFGPSIDLGKYDFEEDSCDTIESLEDLTSTETSILSDVAFDLDEEGVSASFVQRNNDDIFVNVMEKQPGLEILSTMQALEKYDWLSDYLWKVVTVDQDKYTSTSELEMYNGYFIRAKTGAKIKMPVQSCLLISRSNIAQNVHNIVIAEPGSELHIISGCATPPSTEHALHIGVSEVYIGENAKLSFTMMHRWVDTVDVRPRSGAIVEKNGVYMSNYAILSNPGSIQMNPTVRLVGEGSRSDLNSVIHGSRFSKYDVGGILRLEAPYASGKVVNRSIATDSSEVISRGDLIGKSARAKGRVECDGLLLSDKAKIIAVPALQALAEGAELSHEATVGKVGEEQLSYLMSRGLTEEESVSLIVSGFVDLQVPDLPSALQSSVDYAIKLSLSGGM
jgi:Fe-S cluster assembly scaffold protein SufB